MRGLHDTKRIKKVQAWVDDAAKRMHVIRSVFVAPEFCAGDAHAEISDSDFNMRITLGIGFFDLTPAMQRDVLTHEICHVYFEGFDEILKVFMVGVLIPKDVKRLKALMLVKEHEVIDLLMRTIAPSLPLPKF